MSRKRKKHNKSPKTPRQKFKDPCEDVPLDGRPARAFKIGNDHTLTCHIDTNDNKYHSLAVHKGKKLEAVNHKFLNRLQKGGKK